MAVGFSSNMPLQQFTVYNYPKPIIMSFTTSVLPIYTQEEQSVINQVLFHATTASTK